MTFGSVFLGSSEGFSFVGGPGAKLSLAQVRICPF